MMHSAHKVNVARVWSDIIDVLCHNAGPLLLALILPTIVITTVELRISGLGMQQAILLKPVSWVFAMMFAVSTHRIVLLGRESLPNPLGVYFNSTILMYLLYSFLIGVITWFSFLMASLIIVPFSQESGSFPHYSILTPFAVLFLYLTARVNMVLPARAIDDRLGLVDAFELTKGNGWRLVLATVIPPVLMGILLVLVWFLVATLSLQLSIITPNHWVLAPLAAVSVLAGSAVAIASLSCAYRELQRLPVFEQVMSSVNEQRRTDRNADE